MPGDSACERASPGTFCVVIPGQTGAGEAKPEFEMDAHDNPATVLPVMLGKSTMISLWNRANKE